MNKSIQELLVYKAELNDRADSDVDGGIKGDQGIEAKFNTSG